MDAETRELLEEAYRRQLRKADAADRFALMARKIEKSCHPKQQAYVTDKSRRISLLCPRRSGKTKGIVRRLRRRSLQAPEGIARFWGITRVRAQELAWEEMKKLDAFVGLREDVDVVYNEARLTARLLATGVEFRLAGADKPKEAEKKRGDSSIEEAVDESQLFSGFLKKLAEDVIEPGLADLLGGLTLGGTPGVTCHGYWFGVSGTKVPEDKRVQGFKPHRWNVKDNAFRPHLWEEFLAHKASKGWADDNPTWVREYLGEWADDLAALFYAFDPAKNLYQPGAVVPYGDGWQHSLGWDLGLRDAMAITVIGWRPDSRTAYEAFSWKKSGALMDEVVAVMRECDKRFNIVAQCADTGGGGAAFVAEFSKRFGISFEAARKTDKAGHVELFNDDLRTSRLKLLSGSPWAEEIAQLPKDESWDVDEHDGKPAPEDGRYPNHCCDAGLYAWRHAYSYLHEEEKAPVERDAVREFDELEQRIIASRERHIQQARNGDGYATWAEE